MVSAESSDREVPTQKGRVAPSQWVWRLYKVLDRLDLSLDPSKNFGGCRVLRFVLTTRFARGGSRQRRVTMG